MRVKIHSNEPDHELKGIGHLITWAPEKKVRFEVLFEFGRRFFSILITKAFGLSFSRLDVPVRGTEYYGRDVRIGFVWLHSERGN